MVDVSTVDKLKRLNKNVVVYGTIRIKLSPWLQAKLVECFCTFIITRPVSMLLAAARDFFPLLLRVRKTHWNIKNGNKILPDSSPGLWSGVGWGCEGRRGEVWEGRNPGESLERTRGRGKSDESWSSTPLHKDNKKNDHPWTLPFHLTQHTHMTRTHV